MLPVESCLRLGNRRPPRSWRCRGSGPQREALRGRFEGTTAAGGRSTRPDTRLPGSRQAGQDVGVRAMDRTARLSGPRDGWHVPRQEPVRPCRRGAAPHDWWPSIPACKTYSAASRRSGPVTASRRCSALATVGRSGSASKTCSPRERGPGVQMEMLVGEQKQDRIALLLGPAGRRSLARSTRSRRECCLLVK